MAEDTPQDSKVVVRYRVSDYTRFLLNKHFMEGKWKGKWKTREDWMRVLIDEPYQEFEKK